MKRPAVWLVIVATIQLTLSQNVPHYVNNRSTMVNLFEWKWTDIADECERFLAPKGYAGVQVSPPNENVVISNANRPWWERYQPISYNLVTRSGNEAQFAEMVRRCNAVGVRVYVDIVINHMAAVNSQNVGTGGSTADPASWSFPAVPYTRDDFNRPECQIQDGDYQWNAINVRNCELFGLKDLYQGSEYVRGILVEFLNKLINHGVAGFRIGAAKHMWPHDLEAIFARLNNLNTGHGFSANSRAYIYQEVVDYGGEAISRDEYTHIGAVTEFRYGRELSNCFRGYNSLKWLVNWGPDWALLNDGVSFVFIENHDNQRDDSNILNYKNSRPYKAAIGFMLAHPYGRPQIFSGYDYTNNDAGPPSDSAYNTISPTINSDDTCGNGWICEHRWRQIYAMAAFKNTVDGTSITGWWDNDNNQIAFCRGNRGFVAFNIESRDLDQTLQTCLPAGRYCDVVSGNRANDACLGKTLTVNADGTARIQIGANEEDAFIAIHVGPESRLDESVPDDDGSFPDDGLIPDDSDDWFTIGEDCECGDCECDDHIFHWDL